MQIILALFILLNVIAAFHAWKFTHFADTETEKTKDETQLTFAEKVLTVFSGISIPRPQNKNIPDRQYETFVLESNRRIECWYIKNDSSVGTVLILHGFSGSKDKMLDKAEEFLLLGYNCMLVDLMGAGGSEGNQTTIGYKEAEQVKTCYEYLQQKGEKNIVLFGTSMGAVAIMKAMNDYCLGPSALILECPFGSLYQTVCARFNNMNLPEFPMASLLVFWGGIENGFWAFDHKPTEYAKKITCPVLLMCGLKDEKVSREETKEIYKNFGGNKKLLFFPEARHENYLKQYKEMWVQEVRSFLDRQI